MYILLLKEVKVICRALDNVMQKTICLVSPIKYKLWIFLRSVSTKKVGKVPKIQNWSAASYSFKRLALWVKISADNISKYFSNFSKKTGFDISCRHVGDNVHESQTCFLGKIRKNIINLSSAELADESGKCYITSTYFACFWQKNVHNTS